MNVCGRAGTKLGTPRQLCKFAVLCLDLKVIIYHVPCDPHRPTQCRTGQTEHQCVNKRYSLSHSRAGTQSGSEHCVTCNCAPSDPLRKRKSSTTLRLLFFNLSCAPGPIDFGLPIS